MHHKFYWKYKELDNRHSTFDRLQEELQSFLLQKEEREKNEVFFFKKKVVNDQDLVVS